MSPSPRSWLRRCPAVRADRRRLHQILLTVLTNAALFTTRGLIKVTAELGEALPGTEPGVDIRISDTGPGIPESELRTVFAPFTGDRPSSGLGLAISHELAKLMHGELTVDSQEGAGTTFTLVIPPAGDAVRMERLVRTRSRVGHGRVLVMADNPQVRGLLESRLGALGMQVVTVQSAETAQRSAQSLAPSALVVDLGLLRRDPWSELLRLCERPPLNHVPIVAIGVEQLNAVYLPMGGMFAMPPNKQRLQERIASVAHPGRPVLVVGAGLGTVRVLRDLGYPVQHTTDQLEAAAALDDVGVMMVDLLADGGALLPFALEHAGRVPTLGLLPAAPPDEVRASTRRVLLHHVRSEGASLESMVDELVRRLGPFHAAGEPLTPPLSPVRRA